MKKIFLALSFLIALPIVYFILIPKQDITSAPSQELNVLVKAVMEESAIPGLALAKIENGQISLIESYGLADVNKNKMVTNNTLFKIASISKPIMGLVLMQLVDQNKLDLDRNINDYLSFEVNNPKIEGEIITTRHLATHSAGIDDFWDENTFSANKDPDLSLKEHLISLLSPQGKNYQNGAFYLPYFPGKERQYSNLSAGLAGQLVEDITGESLAEYSKNNLFKSLDLKHTSWILSDLNLDDIAVPYEVEQCIPYIGYCATTQQPENNEFISEYFNPPINFKNYQAYPHFGDPQYPDGGVRTSITDLAKLLVAVLKNKDNNGKDLLSASSYREMFSLQLAPEVSSDQRFFWRDNKMGLTGHTGSDLGVFTTMYFDVKTQSGFIILMNRGMDSNSAKAMKKIAYKLVDKTETN